MKKTIIILLAVAAFLGISVAMSRLIEKMTEVAPGVSYDEAEQQRFSLLRSLPPDAIQRITVFNRYGTTRLQIITNAVALQSFTSSLNSLQPYSPNHPRFDEQMYVVADVKDRDPIEFDFCHLPSQPAVILYFVKKNGTRTRFFGHARSPALFDWMLDHTDLWKEHGNRTKKSTVPTEARGRAPAVP